MDHLLRNAHIVVPLAKIDKIDAAFREREFARGQSTFAITCACADRQTIRARMSILRCRRRTPKMRRKTSDELNTLSKQLNRDQLNRDIDKLAGGLDGGLGVGTVNFITYMNASKACSQSEESGLPRIAFCRCSSWTTIWTVLVQLGVD
jgi:hypothetical protein